jgi:hypothetical protein
VATRLPISWPDEVRQVAPMFVQWPAVRKKFWFDEFRTLKPSEQRAELVRIASPPLIRCVTGVLSVSTRAAEPARAAAALSAVTAAPLAPAGSESTTWLLTGSMPHADPTTAGAFRNDACTPASCAALCATSFGVAPDARTAAAEAWSVTLTTSLPAESR